MFFHFKGRKETQNTPWSVWVSCSSHVPSQPLTLIQFTGLRCLEENPWCCTSIAQPQQKLRCLINTLLYPQMRSTAPCKLLWRKLTPSQPDSVQHGNCSANWCTDCFNKILMKMLEVYRQDEKKKAQGITRSQLDFSEIQTVSLIWLES